MGIPILSPFYIYVKDIKNAGNNISGEIHGFNSLDQLASIKVRYRVKFFFKDMIFSRSCMN
jgi:hypothetical protein